MLVVDVLIEYANYKLDRPFSYIYKGNKKIDIGFRVLLNFKNRELVGYVLNKRETNESVSELEEKYGFKLEEIIDVIDVTCLLKDDLLKLADEISDYYLAPKISVLQAMLPNSLSPKHSFINGPKIAYDKYIIVLDNDVNGLTAKQIELLRLIGNDKVLKSEIKSVSILKKLIELGKVKEIKEEKRRLILPESEVESAHTLTQEQKRVVDEFLNTNDKVYLLDGVTGSGKTEVYLHICENIINKGKTVLMLVPEIALTPMMVKYFINRFNKKVAVLHSDLTPGQKYDEYRKISAGECQIVVGARSAIFAPLDNIGLIILDEEHVESYKQDNVPFYHAREVAIMRAKMHGAKVLLGSATPSLETRARAQNGVYHLLKLKNRINNQPLPKATIVDMTDMKNISRDSYIFSNVLKAQIRETLNRHEQAILLVNRRGFSSTLSCRKCGHIFKCPNCGVPLTYHRTDGLLKCHHCDHSEIIPDSCPECGSKYFGKGGFGTEKIEEEVSKLFPNAKCLRLDSDNSKIKSRISETIEAFRKHEADILIGTQMIAKGHDFPDVSLVGLVLADIGLYVPSYRSSEHVFQLITQAIGRGGRSDITGRAIIQTYLPKDRAIILGAKQDYDSFYISEMLSRKQQNYPPYTYLTSITISSTIEERTLNESNQTYLYLKDEFKNRALIIGPAKPYISFFKNEHLRTILVKYKDLNLGHEIFKKLLNKFKANNLAKIEINIDPYNF